MTVRPGQAAFFKASGGALATAAGNSNALNNAGSWAVLVGLTVQYVATATVGNRLVSFRVQDPINSNFVVFQNVWSTPIIAGQTVRLYGAAGLPNQAFTTPLMQIMGLPVELPVLPAVILNIFDANNVDVNDTLNFLGYAYAM